jgi:hypothetical protein
LEAVAATTTDTLLQAELGAALGQQRQGTDASSIVTPLVSVSSSSSSSPSSSLNSSRMDDEEGNDDDPLLFPDVQERDQMQRQLQRRRRQQQQERFLLQKQQQREQHEHIERLMVDLQGRVRETSAGTDAKIEALHVQLADARLRQTDLHRKQLEDLHEELGATECSHEHRTRSMQARHDQAVSDLETQLRSYREQTVRQEQDLLRWNERYQQLEMLAVTPLDAEKVLRTVLAFDEKKKKKQEQMTRQQLRHRGGGRPTPSSAKSSTTGRIAPIIGGDGDGDDDNEAAEVHQQVVQLLSRAVQCRTVLEDHTDDVKQHWEVANQRHAETEDEYDFLQLQRRLLREDMEGTRSEGEWRKMLAEEQDRYQQELEAMLRQEELRLEEMDALEVELNHLALEFVQREDLENEYQQRERRHMKDLEELHLQSQATAQTLKKLRDDVNESVVEGTSAAAARQTKELGVTVEAPQSAEEQRIRLLVRALARRDDELERTKDQLRLSQERIQALEEVGSTKLSGRRRTGPVEDYDTDSTAATVSS